MKFIQVWESGRSCPLPRPEKGEMSILVIIPASVERQREFEKRLKALLHGDDEG